MSTLPAEMRAQIAAWLAAGEIEVFVGYEPGPLGLRATPAFVRQPEDVGRLIWDATCENNLVAFLKQYRGKKVGLMVKGCDARAIVGLMQERQWKRENLRIVGGCCAGVVDSRRAAERLGVTVEDLDEARIDGDEIVLYERRLPVADALFDMCRACDRHNPTDCDVRLGDEIAPAAGEDRFAHVHAMEALSAAERWARFSGEVARCNLCFACRNACPLCYCTVCFVDKTMPRWFAQSTCPEDLQFYQVMRTFHLAGRCVGCGACTRACPQGIDIRLFLDKLRKDVAELYDYDAGVDADARSPLTTYRETDYNDFVL
ncbi:MAG: 4Fe-4S ferredoxin [Chloroflexota bacterium]